MLRAGPCRLRPLQPRLSPPVPAAACVARLPVPASLVSRGGFYTVCDTHLCVCVAGGDYACVQVCVCHSQNWIVSVFLIAFHIIDESKSPGEPEARQFWIV